MSNILFNKWVKIVNNLRITGITSRILCDYSSTKTQHSQHQNFVECVKTIINNLYITHHSTTKDNQITPLNKSCTYFPQYLLLKQPKER